MRITITGGSGFVGHHLSLALLDEGHDVTALGRRPADGDLSEARYHYVRADTSRPGEWQREIAGADLVINLAGKSIFHRWTRSSQQEMLESRVRTTRHVIEALPPGGGGVALISASAVGYYGNRGEAMLTESAGPGGDFLAELCHAWEEEAFAARTKQIRVVTTRLGIVLREGGGVLKIGIPVFRAYLGGRVGSGSHWLPWIDMADLIEAFLFLIAHPEIDGPVNVCAPYPVRQRRFAERLGEALDRPSMLQLPACAARLVLGDLATALLASQRAYPERLLTGGFAFHYPRIRGALADIAARYES